MYLVLLSFCPLHYFSANLSLESSFTYSSQCHKSFNWSGYGFRMKIPKDALPVGVSECQLDVKTGLTGTFHLPKNTRLVSGLYQILCPHKLIEAATVEIQHCIAFTDPRQLSALSFVVARCSQEEQPYRFKCLEGGLFSTQSSYGKLDVNEFSIYGIIANILSWFSSQQDESEGSDSSRGPPTCNLPNNRYCASVFYIERDRPNTWGVDLVIFRELEVCSTVSWPALLLLVLYGTPITSQYSFHR